MQILAGDIGGTKVRMALCDAAKGFAVGYRQTYQSRAFPSFAAIVEAFLADSPMTPSLACVGVAGPVIDNRVNVTNLPWVVDGRDFLERGFTQACLVNDIVAHASGIQGLGASSLTTLQVGEARAAANRCLIAAGTGLGECALVHYQGRWLPSPSEGGHTDFSPTSEEEIALLRFLRLRYKRVSWERVLSGKFGFRNIADFYQEQGDKPTSAALQAAMATADDLGPALVEAANAGDPFADRCLTLFARLYGSEAGNLALKYLALSGVYIGGGIAKHILPWLQGASFQEALVAKGRFGPLVATIPVHVIMDEDIALKGAAFYADQTLRGLT